MDTIPLPAQIGGKKQGKLTIFASYFSGTGKSYAMLGAAEKARQAGADAVIGLLCCDLWPQTRALARKFETLPCKTVDHSGQTEYEVDLDVCLKRLPQLILIDDLAHLNGDTSRHRKRYQDIEELLKAGVDVYTTLDIQHIESIQDTIFSILGYSESKRIPDHVFDQAAQVEFVDIEPQRLQQRLLEQTKGALLSNCSLSQLSALQETGLRRCADRAALYTHGIHNRAEYRTHEHILVCLSSAPSNEKIIRTAARMASAFQCGFTALFVETKEFQWMTQPDKERLQANIHLAQQLGASIETVYGDDVAYQIAEFSRLSGVTKIVLGRSGIPRRPWFHKASLTERLIELSPELDIHIIPDNASNLLSNGDLFDTKTKEQMYTDIYDDAMWLINLVENLLSVSRLEEGRMNLHVATELIDEVVAEALRHINRKSVEYHLHVQNSDEYLLAQIDAKLIVQVLINIVDNAIKYTPPGSEIDISWKRNGNFIEISVADNGPGISDQAKPHVFDMFYSASNRIADSRRSMGLGLALCKSIVNAHGGEITVTDHLPHGSIFTFSVPAGEVELHE